MQAVNLEDDPVNSYLKELFLLSAADLDERKRREGVTEIDVRTAKQLSELLSLMDSAVHISVVAGGDEAFADLAKMLSRLADAWPQTHGRRRHRSASW